MSGGVVFLQKELADFFGRRYCVLTNRGTTALTASLHALNRPVGTKVLFPAALCSVPVFASRFAGWTPVFADVSLDDGNFDLNDVQRVLEEGGVGAVVPIHMFGKPDDMNRLKDLCQKSGADLLEDGALSMGACFEDRPVGALGRLSCLSFVRKMLPLEMGGAVLTDELELAERVKRFVDQYPPEEIERRDEVSAAMKAFHALTGYVAAGGWARGALLDPFEEEFKRLLLASTSEADWDGSIVLEETRSLADGVQARRVRAEVLDTSLIHPLIKPLDRTGSSLFAYPFRVEGISVEKLLDFSSRAGYPYQRIAYPVVSRVFGDPSFYPNAERLEREVMGISVNEQDPVSSFWATAETFLTVLNQFLASNECHRPFDTRGKLELRMGGNR